MLFLMASWRQMRVDGERQPARLARQDTAAGVLLPRIFSKMLFGSFSRKCPPGTQTNSQFRAIAVGTQVTAAQQASWLLNVARSWYQMLA